jgi:hypothetical protein
MSSDLNRQAAIAWANFHERRARRQERRQEPESGSHRLECRVGARLPRQLRMVRDSSEQLVIDGAIQLLTFPNVRFSQTIRQFLLD